MRAADVLEEMRGLLQRRAELKRRLERAKERACGAPGIGDGMPKGNASDGALERTVLECTALEGDIAEIEGDLRTYRRKVQPQIERMPTGIARTLLTLRYCQWMSMAKMARAAGYSYTNGYRALRNAEGLLEKLRSNENQRE